MSTNLKSSDAPFHNIGSGLTTGQSSLTLIGRANDADPGDGIIVVASRKLDQDLPTTALELHMVSTSAQDAVAGTGGYNVQITYLDTDWKESFISYNLNGTTEVALGVNARRVLFARVSVNGSGAASNAYTPAGDVSITFGSGGTVACVIEAGVGVCAFSQYTVPAGKSAAVGLITTTVEGGTNEADFFLNIQGNDAAPSAPYNTATRFPLITEQKGTVNHDMRFASNVVMSERTDFWMSMEAANSNTSASATVYLIVRDV